MTTGLAGGVGKASPTVGPASSVFGAAAQAERTDPANSENKRDRLIS